LPRLTNETKTTIRSVLASNRMEGFRPTITSTKMAIRIMRYDVDEKEVVGQIIKRHIKE